MNLRGLHFGWTSLALNAFGKRIWRLALAAVCWAIWLERNNRVFKGYSEPAWRIYRRAKVYILFWVKL